MNHSAKPSKAHSQDRPENSGQALEDASMIHKQFAQSWTSYMLSTAVPQDFLKKDHRESLRRSSAVQDRLEESFQSFAEASRTGAPLFKAALQEASTKWLDMTLAPFQFVVEMSLSFSRAGALSTAQWVTNAAESWLVPRF